MRDEKILKNGEEVLLFNEINQYNSLLTASYMDGVIKSSYQSDDMSYHGSPWYIRIYQVVGIDGREYKASRSGLVGNYIMTKEDYSRYLEGIININNNKIKNIEKENETIKEKIKSL